MQFEPIYRTLEVLLVYQLYFSVAQVEELLKALLERHVPLTVIVRCLQLLFSRVVDIENFNILLNKMNLSDREEIYHRIGILNIWNPLYPGLCISRSLSLYTVDEYTIDIDYKLYLSSWDHREAAKILFRLAALEPGENLREQYYYHSVVEDAFPGWELPLSWTLEGAGSEIQALISAGKKIQEHHDEEGKLPKFGVVTFTYTSDPAAGCQADVNERDQLARTRSDFILNFLTHCPLEPSPIIKGNLLIVYLPIIGGEVKQYHNQQFNLLERN